jgi:hypothetical protein
VKPTPFLRFVWDFDRHILQQWFECEGYEHPDYLANGGEWQDVTPYSNYDSSPPIGWERKDPQ